MSNKNNFNLVKQQKAMQWLQSKWPLGSLTCESCGNKQWQMADFFIVSPRFEGGISIGGQIAPQVMLTCSNCANTKHFNAVAMGLIDKEEP